MKFWKWFYLLRLSHVLKNLILFAPLVFSKHLVNFSDFLRTEAAFLVFCILCSAVYVINDLQDLGEDRLHPLKKTRPLAAGEIRRAQGFCLACGLLTLGFLGAWGLGKSFLIVCITYVLIQVLYSLFFKHLLFMDVSFIAFGYILRGVAGAAVIQVRISHWLLISTFFLALFLALGKRRQELMLGEEEKLFRPVLQNYRRFWLDCALFTLALGIAFVYGLYTISKDTFIQFGSHALVFTWPFVIYGLVRYLNLLYRKSLGGDPVDMILKDFPLQCNVILWILSCIWVVYR
ncbi:MAG: decaprenyl-phosphate phosphoribosyltransferase [Chlamydiae bacterium]|nr:decaprenyl-phosphate phosphoribosyltransferase [Chlamydiota bacterium]MBI3265535.1 decaprenyl-phosphate phosphoribosyltransferase [Chlamydiota bacterium]